MIMTIFTIIQWTIVRGDEDIDDFIYEVTPKILILPISVVLQIREDEEYWLKWARGVGAKPGIGCKCWDSDELHEVAEVLDG